MTSLSDEEEMREEAQDRKKARLEEMDVPLTNHEVMCVTSGLLNSLLPTESEITCFLTKYGYYPYSGSASPTPDEATLQETLHWLGVNRQTHPELFMKPSLSLAQLKTESDPGKLVDSYMARKHNAIPAKVYPSVAERADLNSSWGKLPKTDASISTNLPMVAPALPMKATPTQGKSRYVTLKDKLKKIGYTERGDVWQGDDHEAFVVCIGCMSGDTKKGFIYFTPYELKFIQDHVEMYKNTFCCGSGASRSVYGCKMKAWWLTFDDNFMI